MQLTQVYEQVTQWKIMETTNSTKKESTWNKMVHASFRKVVAFDLLCLGIGIAIGMGIGVYLIAGT